MMMRNSSCSSLNTTTTSSSDGEGAAAAEGMMMVLKKGPWTAAEDAILMVCVQKHREGNWNAVQKNSGLARCGKSYGLPWANHLRPNLKKGSFTPEEEMLILQLHSQLGNKWSRMAAQLCEPAERKSGGRRRERSLSYILWKTRKTHYI